MVIVDTSCLIALDRSGELNILNKVFGKITLTPEIRAEYGKDLPDWIGVISVDNVDYREFLEAILDKGEASAIALVQEVKNALLVIDEQKGRKVAERIGINFTGTLGVLVEAKRQGHIRSLKTVLTKLKLNDFRISEEIESEILQKVNEK